MNLTNPTILRHLVQSKILHASLPSVCKLICLNLDKVLKDLNIASFRREIKKCLRNFNKIEQLIIINEIKSYLESRDSFATLKLQPPASGLRYWLNRMGITKATNPLQPVLNCLDSLADQINATPARKRTKILFSTRAFAFIAAISLINRALAASSSTTLTRFQSEPKYTPFEEAAIKQCSIYTEFFDQDTDMASHPSFATLAKMFHIVSANVPFSDVQYFYFGEFHNRPDHIRAQEIFINTHARVGDVIRLEGFADDQYYDCTRIPTHPIGKSFSSSLKCMGWENPDLHRKVVENLDLYEAFRSFYNTQMHTVYKKIKEFEQSVDRIQCLQAAETIIHSLQKFWKQYGYLEALLGKEGKATTTKLQHILTSMRNYKADEATTLSNLRTTFRDLAVESYKILVQFPNIADKRFDFSKEIIIERNKNLMRLNKLSQNTNHKRKNKLRYYTTLGAAHIMWFTKNTTSLDKLYQGSLSSLRYDDECFELRQSLKDQPHAILYPR